MSPVFLKVRKGIGKRPLFKCQNLRLQICKNNTYPQVPTNSPFSPFLSFKGSSSNNSLPFSGSNKRIILKKNMWGAAKELRFPNAVQSKTLRITLAAFRKRGFGEWMTRINGVDAFRQGRKTQALAVLGKAIWCRQSNMWTSIACPSCLWTSRCKLFRLHGVPEYRSSPV